MCNRQSDKCFAALGSPKRVWTVPAVHGNIEALTGLHDRILERIEPGDRLIYLGNYTGYGEHSAACMEELLTFRRMVLSIPGIVCSDITYLRGIQEEMWQKLLQLQFSPDPSGILLWMLGNGLSATLYSYGLSPHDGIESCRGGTLSITKWIAQIRETVRSCSGHDTLRRHMLRAAYTSLKDPYPMLFVHAGLEAEKTLDEQGDSLWWATEAFETIKAPYAPFQKVIRGYDPTHKGLHLNCVTATIDAGCGFGGTLLCAGFESDGSVAEIFEA